MSSKFILRSPKTVSDFQKYYDLRWEILRKPWNQPKGSERDPSDNKSYHILTEIDGDIVGIGCVQLFEDGVGRIRFMAVADGYQKQGIGQAIVYKLENYAAQQRWTKIRLWARESAITFYKNIGYEIVGDGYTIFDVIHHKVMEKKIG